MRNLSRTIIPISEGRPSPPSYQDALIWAAENPATGRKRDVTRARLLAATARVMGANTYAGLRVADIAASAGMSSAAFHVYFVDRDEAAREVLSGLLRRLYVSDPDAGPCGAHAFVPTIRSHIEALQNDAPLVQALNQAVRLDGILAELSDCAVRLWRARLDTMFGGSSENDLEVDASAAPDVLDLIIAGIRQRAGAPLLTPDAMSRVATEIGRAWAAVRKARPRSGFLVGAHGQRSPAG